MSEPLVKPRPMIDLDEFERRLRPTGNQTDMAAPVKGRDPLSELARLVDGHEDPYERVFTASRPGVQAAPRPDFSAIEAGLRGSIDPREPQFPAADPYGEEPWHPGERIEPQHDFASAYAPMPATEGWRAEASEAAVPAAPRSRRPLYVMGAVVAFGVIGIGGSMALKSRLPGSHEVATIKAATGPTKIQPDAPGGVDVANQDASILDRGPTPSKVALVDRAEQPVDLSQIQPRPSRTVAIPAAAAPGAADAAAIPASASQTPPTSIAALIEPKKVKTISVKPDGTVVNAPAPAMPTIASLAAVPPTTAASPQSATPATRPATQKASARVAPPKPAADAEDNGGPMQLGQSAKAKPAAKPVKVAAVEADDTVASAPSGSGGFAVQLAAPGSEQEAKTASASLQRKFAGELGGYHTSIHKATVGDKSVFRIRVGGLSRDEASSLCKKLQAGGGSCFVAKN